MIKILLSRRLGELRMTQSDLANMTGVRPTTVGAYYNELTPRINLEHFSLFCKALDCELSDLLVYEPDETEKLKYRTGKDKESVSQTNS